MKKPSQFDAIVVGAGPSGNAAAYVMAKAGLKVLQIERGEYPGSKNVQGAILYARSLEEIIPDFRDDAPLERHIIEQRMWMLDDTSFVGTHVRSDDYNQPPYNRYTIIRAQFDKWFSSKVREAGALLICETTVNHLIMDGDQVVGVQCDREQGDVYADVVILADGVNSTLARKAGFHGEIEARNVALAVKEILFMPEETIRQRFNIGEEEGVVIEMIGRITDGMMGTGFLYTNKESLTIGVGCMLSDFKRNPNRTSPYVLLEQMKRHPSIAPLIAGGEMKEYCAHLIPEGGFNAIPRVYGNGWMIVGDSGGFVNAAHREGSNLAMTTGRLAAETVIAARVNGHGYRASALAAYKSALDNSFVMKDLHKYRDMPGILHDNPQFFTTYPDLVANAARTMITVDGVDKTSKKREVMANFRKHRSLGGLVGDAYKLWRAFR
ncbi:electron transfer flavoprotein-quinone oxidoreductase [Paraburkholderia tropica]|uniref:Protein FixC n=2 Tax=Paraburkholderia tropica TaxID=92647 RepID=A0AAQ1GNZ2_9BURK|nr:FAD-dependent monooxygenase [Paraburkholderia tropica]MBB2984025.1 electron transfer flavoprotein-quinone oxidoreductase [Paraburkholderia tropica]MBB3004747.1 electron transfer flavoprotein-quinone oxidoreductase [Paraburkholderia tropica]MBB6323847.1 electron transfer flavoprotein-quinone oxidoreductase [Paraburkholderia tropica]PXX07888.1 flavin-dependent dehydrogenase [Paraburkholderia tropica]PZW73308.1 flavin-dependent dehydrogenase [Paraburkholderia tropica]